MTGISSFERARTESLNLISKLRKRGGESHGQDTLAKTARRCAPMPIAPCPPRTAWAACVTSARTAAKHGGSNYSAGRRRADGKPTVSVVVPL